MAKHPKRRDDDGITVPVRFVRARDADTIEVTGVLTNLLWAVRLKDCWAPEIDEGSERSRELAHQGKLEAAAACEHAGDELRATVPINADHVHEIRKQGRHLNPLDFTSFDRVVGYIWLTKTETLNERLVRNGFASSTKGGGLGE